MRFNLTAVAESRTSTVVVACSMIFGIAVTLILLADLLLGLTLMGGFEFVSKFVPLSESCHP